MRPQRSMEPGERCLQAQKGGERCALLSCRSLGSASTLFEKARRARIGNRLRSVNAHAEQKGFKLRRTGNSPKIQEPHNGGNGHWRSAKERGCTRTCSRSPSPRDCAVARRHACRPVIRQALRRARIHLWVDQWSQKPHLTKDRKNILCKTENFVSLVVRDFRHVPAQAHLRHRRRRIHRIHWIEQIHEVRREQRETACRIFRSGWRTSQKISKTQKCQHPQNISRDSDLERPINMAPRKRSIYTHFPKDQNCEVCKRIKITRALCRRRIGESVHGQKFGDLITADHKVLNEVCDSRNNHLYSVVVQDLPTQWIQSYPCKTKNYPGDGKELTKVSRADWKAESHLHRQLIGLWQILWRLFMESSYFDTPGIAERAVRRIKEGTSEYYCNQAWMKSGGLILCNAIAICEMFKTYRHMGKHLTNDDSENHWKARSFRAVQLWLNIIRLLQKTSQGPTTLVRHF